MPVSLSRILDGLASSEVIHTSIIEVKAVYQGVTYIPHLKEKLMPEYVYIGKASSFSSKALKDTQVACLIVQDQAVRLHIETNAIVFPEKTDIVQLFNVVQELFVLQDRLRDCSADIFNALVKGGGIQGILDVGLRILRNPLMLSDSSSRFIAVATDKEITDPAVKDILTYGFSSQKYMNEFEVYRIVEKMETHSQPILLDTGFSKDVRRIIGKVTFNNKMIAYLLTLEMGRSFSDDDYAIINMLCEAISLEMSINKAYASYTGEIHEHMMIDLLEEKSTPSDIKNKMRSLQWEVNNEFYVMAVLIPKIDSAYSYMEYTRMRIKNIASGCQIVYYEPYMVILFSPKDQENKLRVQVTLNRLFSERQLVAGVGLPFESIMDLKKHYLQAVRSIELGRLLRRDEQIFEYENYFIYDILSLTENKAALTDFFHHHLIPLMQYDKSKGTDYYHTLHAYLKHALNKTSTANDLSIHRNTIDHRIQKIAEIIHLDLSNGDNCFKLFTAYKIAELMRCAD